MDGGRFPGVSTNCRWAGGSGPQRGEGHGCPNAWCHCYSNQTCSLIHMTPGPDSLWGLCPESLAVVQAGPSFSTVSFLDSESGQWGTGVPHLESLLGSPLGAQDSPHLILLLSVPIFHLHPGSRFLLTQSLGPSSLPPPLSWNRCRPTSYSSPLSQLRHTSVCTLPPTRKVAKTRRMRGAAKRQLKATPLEVRDMIKGMRKLTARTHPCPHPHPGASINHGSATRHVSWAKENPVLLATPWHPHPPIPTLLLGSAALVA